MTSYTIRTECNDREERPEQRPAMTNADFRAALALWKQDPEECTRKYGHISDWDTSNVSDMSYAFHNWETFNEPIENWNTANVRNMEAMFCDARSFNQPLEKWNVSKVRNMEAMFFRATSFNQPLDAWRVKNAVGRLACNANRMFHYAASFNQPLPSWNLSSNIWKKSDAFYMTGRGMPMLSTDDFYRALKL